MFYSGSVINDEPDSQTVPQEQARREALRQLGVLAEQIWAQISDLSDEEAAQLAEEISQESMQRMINDRKNRGHIDSDSFAV